MSFNLFVFERRENLKTSVEICSYMEEFTEYKEDKDYNSLEDSSEIIVNWSKKMFEKFPPLNGEYAPSEEQFHLKEIETHLTDYSIGKNAVFCAFGWDVAEEALEDIIAMADEYKAGVYDLQSNEAIYGKGIENLKCRTENGEEVFVDWDNIETLINSLDSVERGTSSRDDKAFITIWFEKDGIAEESYIQCFPHYEKKSFLGNLFGKEKENKIKGYFVEIMKDDMLYQRELSSKEELIEIIKAWCVERKEPDLSLYKEIL